MTAPIDVEVFDPEGDLTAIAPLSKAESDLVNRLLLKLRASQQHFELLNSYYEGLQRLVNIGIAIPPELEHFVVMVNWPRIVADSLEHRIDLEGFRLPGQLKRDENLWRVWQYNNMDEESQIAHLDAIVFGRSYVCVGANEDDDQMPLITVESAMEMTHEIDRRTRKVRAALRYYRDTDESGHQVDHAVLYLKDETIWMEKRWTGINRSWQAVDRDRHELGRVPVVPLINRSRVSDRDGVSELSDVLKLTDAAIRALTLAQLATETLSVPQKVILGATEEDFMDADGKVVPKWEAYFGSVWALENDKAKPFQFTPADLGNFDKIVSLYAAQVASITGLPLRFFGQNTANPPSADGIRADESRLIKAAERRHRSWGGAWEEIARLVKLFQTGEIPDNWVELESIWRSAATPTEAETADAVVKKVQSGILPIEAAWEDLGYSQTKITQLRKLRDKQLADTDLLARQINSYRDAGGVQEGDEDPAGSTDTAGAPQPGTEGQ